MNYTKNYYLFLFFISVTLCVHSQIQIGSDIDGLTPGDHFGHDVSLSSNGNIIAVLGNGFPGGNGRLRVFQNINGVWTLYGTDPNGGNFNSSSGQSISLSADGNILAVGSTTQGGVKIFSYDTVTGYWTQKGNTITNNTNVTSFGRSVSLSADGNIIAIGIPGFGEPPPPEAGVTQIFEYNTGTWNQLGTDINGVTFAEHSGRNVDLTPNGDIVAVANNTSVRVYKNNSGTWTQLGTEISGYEVDDVSLSSNGSVLAIGEANFSDSLIQRGRVRVYTNTSGSWTQIGSTILGEVAYYRTGRSVSLSADGLILAIGEIGSTSGSTDKGRVRVFENQGGLWVQLGASIFGEDSQNYSGKSVSLSDNASTLAIGATHNNGIGSESGHARVFDLGALLSVNDVLQNDIRLFPNPAKDQFTIQLHEGIQLERVDMYNSFGQLIISAADRIINTSDLSSGIYILEINTNKGVAVRKVVVK